MHRQGIRIDFEDMDSEDVYDVFFLCFCRSICIISIKKFSKNFQIILEDKPMMNYCMECGTKLELRHLENEGRSFLQSM